MTWKQLSDARRVQPHTTSKRELDELRTVIERDLNDAAIAELSADRSFATAYNAALQTAKMAIACAGYRVKGEGAHKTSFEAAELAVGTSIARLAVYFETCRRKRNQLDYDVADVASDTEAAEILEKAKEFKQAVETWIAANHPQYA
jgi:uncharacterized protein (UPF0332 family)